MKGKKSSVSIWGAKAPELPHGAHLAFAGSPAKGSEVGAGTLAKGAHHVHRARSSWSNDIWATTPGRSLAVA